MSASRLVAAAALLGLVVTLATCGKGNPPDSHDGGEDAGVVQDAGHDHDAGDDAGGDGGSANACALGPDSGCPEGASCLSYVTPEGPLGTQCFFGACDVVAQDCAPDGTDAGTKCTYIPDAGVLQRACVPAGEAAEGADCQGTSTSNTCAAGLVCVPRPTDDGGVAPRCMRFCNTTADCSQGSACNLMLDLTPSPERPFVCERTCDLFLQDCPQGGACYPTAEAPACFPSAGQIAVGAACAWSSECVKGAVCVNGKCAQLCVFPSDTPSCSSGTCTQLTVAGQPDAGACL